MRTMEQGLWQKGRTAIFVAVVLGLALTCGVTSLRWINTPFPGFFVMANRVIASVSLPRWTAASHRHLYQHAVVAVDGQPLETSAPLYAKVRHLPPGSPVTYTLERDGQIAQVTLPSLVFTIEDYCLLFGAYIFSGLALILIGSSVWFLKPATPASRALFIGGVAGGIFALTGADLYGPSWFFRLHVLGEAVFPAGFLHLALVFPIDRIRRYRSLLLCSPYFVAFGLGIAYELFLYEPTAYSVLHNLCMVYGGISGLALFGGVIWAYGTTHSHLIRQKIRVILIGFLGGFALPTLLMFSSGITGGEVAVNYAGFTIFLFPLSLGYAIVKHDLFDIDAMLKRGVYYLTLTAVLTLTYLAFLALLNFTLRASEFARSPLFPLLFTLAMALLLNPLKEYLQRGVDRVFFRLRYNPREVLGVTSATLASTLQLEEILSFIWRTINETVGVAQGSIYLLTLDRNQYVPVYSRLGDAHSLPAEHPLIQRLRRRGRALALYNHLADETVPSEEQEEGRKELEHVGAQLVLPLTFKGDLIGLLALGNKESGTFFSADDIDFLSTLANQSALSLANALSYQEIQELNASLEQKVKERTQALADANTELHVSLEQLKQAYRDLEHSQEHLLRAEKMAALGRLTAGIAHEMNTPLGASLTSLKLLEELVEEYTISIGDPTVNAHDHQEIALEMDKLVHATQQWMEKAAAHIRSLKLHTRDLRPGEERAFSVLQTIDDTGLLLSHRLRFSQCTLVVSSSASDPTVYGDPSKLGQVLTNLIGNAIDAYKDAGKEGGEIRIEVNQVGPDLEIQVRDQGCGILPENLNKIFDEFFSTKALGEGTGLGLPITRDIVTNFFGGALNVWSVPGQGSIFTLRLPQARKRGKHIRPEERTTLTGEERL